ncbi:MAG: ATP-binding protein [Thermodesulfobacteriota bacterium]|nr:ATP-binding protein [Thermodesulfobacteriota bacterium]
MRRYKKVLGSRSNDYSSAPENILLHQRPSISIRMKVAVSFFLFFILSLTVTGWSYWILTRLEHKINFLEVADSYLVEIQQARRFEKNYLLYGTGLPEAHEHLEVADTILTNNTATIEKILGREHYRTMSSLVAAYHEQLVLLGQAGNEAVQERIVPDLREFGGQMVAFAEDFVEKEQKSVRRMFLLAKRVPLYFMSVVFVLMVFVTVFLTRQLVLTLNRFMEYTRRIGEGDFSPILPARKYKDEFTKLAEAFNHMIKELDHKHKVLLESHKLRAIGTLVAGVAHELNNPLNNTLLTASMLTEDFDTLSDQEKLDMVNDVISETERARQVVKNLLDFAREGETQLAPLEMNKIVKDSARLVANQVRFAKVDLTVSCEPNLPRIHGDEQKLKQVFVNLILNAVDVLPPGGQIHVKVGKDRMPGYVLVTVSDNGPGIPEHIQGRIFEPFFTTKGQGKGTGLGLSVSRGIIKKLGGYIHLTSSPGQGTTFTVSLPTTESPSEIMSK